MHFVVLGVHDADVCPMSNAKSRKLLMDMAPEIPAIAERNHVKIVAGPFVNREHLTVVVTEADRAEDLDRFLVETRLAQWNTVRILPSHPMQQALAEMEEVPALF